GFGSSTMNGGSYYAASAPNSGNFGMGGGGMPKGGEDPNGMERLTGESDEQYIARQTRLREEARVRMKAKFGNSGGGMMMGGVGSSGTGGMGGGGGGGGSRMAGIGSDPNYNPNGNAYDLDGMKSSLVSGFGSAWTTLEGFGRQASNTAASVVNDPKVRQTVNSSGLNSLWSSVTTAAQTVAKTITEPDEENDGLASFHARMREEKERKAMSGGLGGNGNASRYSGFGSDDVMSGRVSGVSSIGARKLSDGESGWDGDFDSFTGSPERKSSSALPTTMTGSAPTIAPATSSSAMSQQVSSTGPVGAVAQKNLGAQKLKMEDTGDDFFAAFGA
ncbi:MAG: hypothetical protein ACRDL7_07665, partial [Gaiellaceae bacterium]